MDSLFNKSNLLKLREDVKGFIGPKRFKHTLGVEKMAEKLAAYLCPDKKEKIRFAALLHDVAKEMKREEQLDLIALYGYNLTEEDKNTPAAYHSFAAAGAVIKYFPKYCDEEIISAVFNHTLGAPDMNLFDEIIFISDYIEENREYISCIDTRNFLLSNIEKEGAVALHKAVIMSIDYTASALTNRGVKIHSKTFLTKNAFQGLI
jgi:predicted HD superfamily hydrolase involved in NAD metabolism